MNDVKALGLRARAFKSSRMGRRRPSNDLLYLWFISLVQTTRKADVQEFDAWLRSEDGVTPYSHPTGLQHSVFPSGFDRGKPTAVSLDWFVYEAAPKVWALTVGGHLRLKDEVDRLPGSGLSKTV